MYHIFAVLIATIPRYVFGAGTSIDNPLGPNANSFLAIICNVRDVLFPALLTLGIISFIVAGFLYLTAAGDKQKTGSAKKALAAAVVGIVLAILSFGLPSITAELMGVDQNSLPQNCR